MPPDKSLSASSASSSSSSRKTVSLAFIHPAEPFDAHEMYSRRSAASTVTRRWTLVTKLSQRGLRRSSCA
jgi:hypothetical protein